MYYSTRIFHYRRFTIYNTYAIIYISMDTYDPKLHTPSQLNLELASLYDTVPDARIVGSLGRAVHHNLAYGDAYREFSARKESPYHVRTLARDIDIIAPDIDITPVIFPIDSDAFRNSEVNLERDGNTWWLTSSERNFAEPLHQDIMQPISGQTINDMPIVTVPWETHLALTSARGPMRQKDKLSADLLYKAGQRIGPTVSSNHLKPFEQLSNIHTSARLRFVRSAYRHLPESIKHSSAPLLKSVGLIR